MSTAPPAEVDYVALDGSPQFRELRRAKRGFCIPLAIVGVPVFMVIIMSNRKRNWH
ncbi:DUF485 domain-containing protein [Corynebacterium otitidis]|uniref:DUF485 domain-containing protein n=1 Tax=Corynebacterium otitidis TaxID=29321 RepID=UPI001F528206|nr:DUF485 domain-containing protein [Corynebacterium otitidis]